MNYHASIIPFIEAQLYLSKRFASERTSKEIKDNRYKKDCLPNYDFSYIEKIAVLERDLDEHFPVTDLMRYYFQPLKLKEQREGDPLSIGGMLLYHLSMPTDDCSIDTLIEQYRSKSQQETITFFYKSYLMPFGLSGESRYTISDFMQTTNDLLIDSEEKWAFVDAAANPVEHLIKLRPLVTEVTEFIRERSAEFDPLIAHIGEFFESANESLDFYISQLRFTHEQFDKMNIFPSLFLFRESIAVIYEDVDYELLFGSFVDVFAHYRRLNRDPETLLALLKVITDSTRFKVLHELCDKSSYGLELAEKYGITRNAMYYHLEKLSDCGLVETAFNDRRMLHTMDKRAVFEKLTALRDYLVNGWKPEDYKE